MRSPKQPLVVGSPVMPNAADVAAGLKVEWRPNYLCVDRVFLGGDFEWHVWPNDADDATHPDFRQGTAPTLDAAKKAAEAAFLAAKR